MAKLSLFDRRRQRVRTSLRATASGKPRLSVHRSGKHIYAQVIDDRAGRTLAAASTLDKELKGKTNATCEGAAAVGKALAERAKYLGICPYERHIRTTTHHVVQRYCTRNAPKATNVLYHIPP